MRPANPFRDLALAGLLETALPDFVLAFAFFTSIAYAVLGKRFTLQRPAIAMSAAIGLALSTGLVWWEQSVGLSIRDLGPIAVGFAIIVLALVMYQSIRHVGGSLAGAGIALGATILIARLLKIDLPVDPQIIQTVVIVALIVGILAFLLRHRAPYLQSRASQAALADVRHDMSDLYRARHLSNRLTGGLRHLRRKANTLQEHPEERTNVILQLKRMLPAEGWLTDRMAQLRAKAHSIRHGHITRLEETREMFSRLSPSAKKNASADLARRYNELVGIDARLERLDRATAAIERKIRDLNCQAERCAAAYDDAGLRDTLKAAQKLQHQNSRLLKIIQRTEHKLSVVVRRVNDRTTEARDIDS